ncbi:MAG: pseudouridine-5'-phosphate glycosidase [Candidatus Promineifilaceae bacterium]|nr:pseudouridine-5'-phosphate glycosidase [Candidatus Promineifilaceae bacterium]
MRSDEWQRGVPPSFKVQNEVAAALAGGRPVVALESTVIAHGLPFPENVQVAQSMEKAVRDGGAVPATIAILQGKVHVGLSADQLHYLAAQPAGAVQKCSRRDLALVIAAGEDGATTVAATMILAYRAGIEIFATGGIGGVHRGHPFDVSADLTELGRTPVTVVCSGAKSILDLPATLEVLETQGVPVLGYQTEELPAFFSRHSGLAVTARVDSAQAVAAIIRARRALALHSGLLVTVPVPAVAAFDDEQAEAAIAQATREADERAISGAEATPWLLQRVATLTEGRSVEANAALLRNNAQVAAQIAAALAGALAAGSPPPGAGEQRGGA